VSSADVIFYYFPNAGFIGGAETIDLGHVTVISNI